VQVFEEIFSDDVINVIVEETPRYAKEYKNKINFSVHPDDVHVLIGFLIFTGYHKLSSEISVLPWQQISTLCILQFKYRDGAHPTKQRSVFHSPTH
jgi:hypothetical protein